MNMSDHWRTRVTDNRDRRGSTSGRHNTEINNLMSPRPLSLGSSTFDSVHSPFTATVLPYYHQTNKWYDHVPRTQ